MRSPSAAATLGTFPTNSAVCRDVAALHASVDRLLGYRPGKNTIASLKADLSEVNTKLAALRQSAHCTLSAQRGPLQAALSNLRDEVTAAVGTGQVSGIVRALGDVRVKSPEPLHCRHDRVPLVGNTLGGFNPRRPTCAALMSAIPSSG